MATYILLAVLCLLPLASAMFLSSPHIGAALDLGGFDYPDQTFLARNAYGQLQSFETNTEPQFIRGVNGGIRQVNMMELSDPEIYTNTVPGAFPGLQNPLLSALQGLGHNLVNNLGTIPGNNLGTTLGANLGTTIGTNLGTTLGANLGNTLGTPLGTNFGATLAGNTLTHSAGTLAGTLAGRNIGGGLSAVTLPGRSIGGGISAGTITGRNLGGGLSAVALPGRSLGAGLSAGTITGRGVGGGLSAGSFTGRGIQGTISAGALSGARGLSAGGLSQNVRSSLNTLNMPRGYNTLNNYVSSYDPYSVMY